MIIINKAPLTRPPALARKRCSWSESSLLSIYQAFLPKLLYANNTFKLSECSTLLMNLRNLHSATRCCHRKPECHNQDPFLPSYPRHLRCSGDLRVYAFPSLNFGIVVSETWQEKLDSLYSNMAYKFQFTDNIVYIVCLM